MPRIAIVYRMLLSGTQLMEFVNVHHKEFLTVKVLPSSVHHV